MLGKVHTEGRGPEMTQGSCVSHNMLNGCGPASDPLLANVLFARGSQRMQIPSCNSLKTWSESQLHSAKRSNNACGVWQLEPRLLWEKKREQGIKQLKLQCAAALQSIIKSMEK